MGSWLQWWHRRHGAGFAVGMNVVTLLIILARVKWRCMVDLAWRWLRWWHVQHTASFTGGVDNALMVPLVKRTT